MLTPCPKPKLLLELICTSSLVTAVSMPSFLAHVILRQLFNSLVTVRKKRRGKKGEKNRGKMGKQWKEKEREKGKERERNTKIPS